jgi:Ion channel.
MTHKAIIVIKSFKFILWILALFNLLISIWIFIGRFWTENGKSWIYEAGINLDSEHNFEIYIHSAYFIVTTGTTIGFGDLTPKSIQEYAICMILEVFCHMKFLTNSFLEFCLLHFIKEKLYTCFKIATYSSVPQEK